MDRVKWPMEGLITGGIADPNAAWYHLLHNSTPSRAVWRHWTVRLDLRHVYWTSNLLMVLETMPNLEQLAMVTTPRRNAIVTKFEGRAFGRVLRSLKRLRSLAVAFGDEYRDVLLAIAFIKVDLDWLALTCDSSVEDDQVDTAWQSFEPKNGLAVKHLSVDCHCQHFVEQLLWMMRPRSVQTLRIAHPTSPDTSLIQHDAFIHAAAHVRSLEICLGAEEEMYDIGELLPELECLGLLPTLMSEGFRSFAYMMWRLPYSVHTLRLPYAQPYMLICLADVLGILEGLGASIKRVDIGVESLQFSASHWLPEYKARVPEALASLGTVCGELDIELIVNSAIWGQASEWSTWIEQPPFVPVHGADGDYMASYARSLQSALWQAWAVMPRKARDERFESILQGSMERTEGEPLVVEEWEEERRLLWEHEVYSDEDDEDTADESESGEDDDGGEEDMDRTGDEGTESEAEGQ